MWRSVRGLLQDKDACGQDAGEIFLDNDCVA